jgi:glutaredoxin
VRFALVLLALLGTVVISNDASASAVSSISSAPVTVYGAKWCSACRSLEKALNDRKIGFDLIDVDDNPAAFDKAKAASGQGSAIPLTSVTNGSKTTWIVGADIEAVDRAIHE